MTLVLLSVLPWFISVMSSRFIHVKASVGAVQQNIALCICHIFIYPLVHPCIFEMFPPFGYCDNAAVDMGVQIPIVLFSLGGGVVIYPEVGMAGSVEILCSVFEELPC